MKKNILCIDDIETNLFTLESVIESISDDLYNVILADSADKGFEMLLKHNIDLILLDIMMPDIDGYEAAQIIKSNKKTKNIPIIFVTAKNDDETISMCYKVGGDDYINKPFNYVELLARISFHIKLKEKEEELKNEKLYIQKILNLQANLIIVTDGEKLYNLNETLLKFYNVKNISQFKEKYKSVENTFIKDDGYFYPKDKNDNWIDLVIELSKKDDILVKIKKDKIAYIFKIKATKFDNKYILELTDITHTSQQTLEYKHKANYDALTKIYNRSMFNRLIDRKMILAREKNKTFVFIILDIDHFKNVNDTYGHIVGDEVLKKLSKLIKKHTRDDDIFARWGGEEFVLVFDVEIDKGLLIAENLRKFIKNEKFNDVGKVTCSFGVTTFKYDDTLESMIKRADKALYKAKENGRNKICHQI